MSEDIFKIVPIYENEINNIKESIIQNKIEYDNALQELHRKIDMLQVDDKLELIREDFRLALVNTIKEFKDRLQDNYLAIVRDVELKNSALLTEMSLLRSSIDILKSNIKCVEKYIAELVENTKESNFMTVYNLDFDSNIHKILDKVTSLEEEIKEIKIKKGFWKRLFGK